MTRPSAPMRVRMLLCMSIVFYLPDPPDPLDLPDLPDSPAYTTHLPWRATEAFLERDRQPDAHDPRRDYLRRHAVRHSHPGLEGHDGRRVDYVGDGELRLDP